MIRITRDMVLSIHDGLIETGGGTPGVLCEGTIDYLIGRINVRKYGYHFDERDEDEIFDVLHKIANYECASSRVEGWLRRISRRL
jgi:hypothetical protein